MHHVYCISGLGADHRIFQKLKIENAELHFINWEIPSETDDMRSYAIRLSLQVKHPEIILIGVSFGGMLASELNRLYSKQGNANTSFNSSPEVEPPFLIMKTILVSSCKGRDEFPGLMQLAAKMRIHKAVPYKLVLRNNTLNRLVFDLKSKDEELYLKRMMLKQNDLTLIKRSINIIMRWNSYATNSLVHIHGTSDRLLSPGNVKADHWIQGGGHFMIWNKAAEVSGIINSILND